MIETIFGVLLLFVLLVIPFALLIVLYRLPQLTTLPKQVDKDAVANLVDTRLKDALERLDEVAEDLGKVKSQVSALSLSAGLKSKNFE